MSDPEKLPASAMESEELRLFTQDETSKIAARARSEGRRVAENRSATEIEELRKQVAARDQTIDQLFERLGYRREKEDTTHE